MSTREDQPVKGDVWEKISFWYRRAIELLNIPEPEAPQLRRRIGLMERDIILPLKAAGIAMLFYSFHYKPWFGKVLSVLDIAVETTQQFLLVYLAFNAVVAIVLLNMDRLPLGLIQWVVFITGLVDALFLSALTLVTGGYQSFLYWMFLALIVRTAVSVPRTTSQLSLNFALIGCYVLAGVINISIAQSVEDELRATAAERRVSQRASSVLQTNDRTRAPRPPGPSLTSSVPAIVMTNAAPRTTVSRPKHFAPEEAEQESWQSPWVAESLDSPAQPLLVRLLLLLLMTACCYGLQLLLERQRRALEEAREFAAREGQLRSVGRLAAEFAHQIKNPLAIIQTASYTLQKSLREGKKDISPQVKIIQEEVERSDQIITQIMSHGQLSDGRVEKVDVREELENAIDRVFPPAAKYPVAVTRKIAGEFPSLVMLRRHVADTFQNLLQNAREALEGREDARVTVSATCHGDRSIEVTIGDNGPGIAADKREKIFEAYYTTKGKGTGLGLAMVKHNVELYGGTVRLESELGKGTRFIVVFPAKSLV